ncbi:hypothetical protein A8D95_10370 [Burkholderia cenocepacia]|nr:hypothetical protein A3203_34455 [Burkholderia cenocepacia]KWF61570.1 hypothetical protein WL89_01120 [Burkholderia cenocepacia]NGO94964.1 hypothetical protein [Burkholderia cenocepacia]ODN63366.1 hypothetical protein BA763_08890 [Burkholderia cenocepacia]ONP21672.1 hypothetical protein A8D84_28600 [Burkholderia cenocepacia]
MTLLMMGDTRDTTDCQTVPTPLLDARRRFILFIMINRMNLMLELIKIGVNQAKFRTRAGTDRRR